MAPEVQEKQAPGFPRKAILARLRKHQVQSGQAAQVEAQAGVAPGQDSWLSPAWRDLPVLAPSLLLYSKPSPAGLETVSFQHQEDWLVYFTKNVSNIPR